MNIFQEISINKFIIFLLLQIKIIQRHDIVLNDRFSYDDRLQSILKKSGKDK